MSLTSTLSNIAALIAIVAFLGLGETAQKILGYDATWTKWIVYALFVFLAYFNSYQLLLFFRKIAKAIYRLSIGLKIVDPQIGENVSDSQFVVRGTYRLKPNPKNTIIFHKAKEGYYPQPEIEIRPETQQWAGDVTIGNTAHQNYTIVVAKCSDDILALIAYFYAINARSVKGNKIGYQAFPLPNDLPGLCELATIRVKLIPRIIDGGSF